jgi:hypothetical protein
MNQLRDFQEAFQRALLVGDDNVLGMASDGAFDRCEVLLNVYRESYVNRLVKMLHDDHECLYNYMGHEKFYTLGRSYVSAYPSHDVLAQKYARHLPEFLRANMPYSTRPELAELALLERNLKDAFYSEDAPVLQLADLADIPPDVWAELQFKPHPSAARIDLVTNARTIWIALKRNKKKRPTVLQLQATEHILVWRQGDRGVFRVLTAEELMMWEHAAAGMRFGAMCQMLTDSEQQHEDFAATRAATYLRSWIEFGLLSFALLDPAASQLNPR